MSVFYRRSLEERAAEAIQFFRNENEELKKSGKFNEANTEEVSKDEQLPQAQDIHSEDTTKSDQITDTIANNVDIEEPSNDIQKSTEKDDLPVPLQDEVTTTVPTDTAEALQSSPFLRNDDLPGPSKLPTSTPPEFTGFHSERTDLDVELDKLDNPIVPKLAPFLGETVPRLSGCEGMVIDLETNEVKAKEKSGVDVLFERFMKTAGKCPKTESTEVR